ncbi:uncharacterized protein PRCAT00000408001 [Priceomyces carsonii]|uniref:uncharacterized protein n=1 Tax=Priceomyces carsonii TaxID=28549 RepID=UPI002ED8FC21|nr:unnamed protein product [Priceomyces carsonii]
MSDNFGRQKSARWVKATVPSYGDEWGEDYNNDFEYASLTTGSEEDINKRYPIDKTNYSTEKGSDDLVLSIDRLKRNTVYADSSSEDEMPDIVDETVLSNNSHEQMSQHESDTSSGSKGKVQGGSNKSSLQNLNMESTKISDNLEPPTPTYNSFDLHKEPDTPNSEVSFQSSADSIQHEPANINIMSSGSAYSRNLSGSVNRDILPNTLGSHPVEGNEHRGFDEVLETGNKKRPERDEVDEIGNLKLSIDDKKSDNDSDESSVNWEVNKSYGNGSDDDKEDALDDSQFDFEPLSIKSREEGTDDSSHHKRIQTDALDSLINDLKSASINNNHTYTFANDGPDVKDTASIGLDSMHSDNDFKSSLLLQSKNRDLSNSSEGRFSSDQNEYGKEPIGDTAQQHTFRTTRRSVRKPPPSRENLISIDYSHIADAVSGYIGDDASIASRDTDYTLEDRGISSPGPYVQSILSSGSLSTGKISINTNGDPAHVDTSSTGSDKDTVSRRVSQMSTNTFNLGNWKPNTTNFRDQFINDNDNESNMNFNPYTQESNNNYAEFTKGGSTEGFDMVSNNSSVSVPETIDAALPDIDEGLDDDHDTMHSDRTSSDKSSRDIGSYSFSETQFTDDSILKEQPHPPAIFKEERSTPNNSREKLNGKESGQKYSSLLPALEPTNDKDSKLEINKRSDNKELDPNEPSSSIDFENRIVSSSTTGSSIIAARERSSSKSKSSSSQKYPPYRWKEIMNISQPIDRIAALKDASDKESAYETGLKQWLNETLKQSEVSSNLHIGKIASEAYQNATHNDIRRHNSLRSKVSIVKDKVETSGLQASSFGKRFLIRGKKLMKSAGNGD